MNEPLRLHPLEAALLGRPDQIDTRALSTAVTLLERSLGAVAKHLSDAQRISRVIADELGYTAEALAAVRQIIAGGRR